MKKFVQKYWKYLSLVMCLVVVWLVSIWRFYSLEKYVCIKEISKGDKFYSFEKLKQTITPKIDQFSKIRLYYYQEGRSEGKLSISVKDLETGEIIHREKISKSELLLKGSYDINIDKQKNSSNRKYELEIENEKDPNDLNFYLYKNQNNESEIRYEIGYYSVTNIAVFYFMLISLSIGFLVISCYTLRKSNIKIETLFLICSSFIYLFYIMVIPTNTSHDELYHFFRAYEVSQGHLTSKISGDHIVSSIPIAVADYFGQNYRDTYHALQYATITEDRVKGDMSTVAVYSPVQYFPQALGIRFTSLFSNNIMVQAYGARLFNAIFSILLLYLAIKLIPFGKRIFFVLAFSPIAIEGFTSVSADALTVSMSFLYLAYILHLVVSKNKKIAKKEYICLLGMSLVLALCKIVYIPLVALLFLLPSDRFKNKKNYFLFIFSIIFIALIFNLGWLKIASKYLSIVRLNSGTQVSFVLHHPISYLSIFLYTICENFGEYLLTALGSDLCWLNTINNCPIVPYGVIVLVFLATFVDKTKESTPLKTKICFWGISLIVIALVFTSLFVQSTPPGYSTIAGVQGRYFLPILPMILLLFRTLKIQIPKFSEYDKIFGISCIFLNILSLLYVMTYFL